MDTLHTPGRRRWLLLGLAAGALASADAALADDRRTEHNHEHEHDHELARRALERGTALPLRSVLDRLEREYPGQVLKVEFEREGGGEGGGERFVYKIRLLQPDGRIAGIKVDAQDGRVLGIRRREPTK